MSVCLCLCARSTELIIIYLYAHNAIYFQKMRPIIFI